MPTMADPLSITPSLLVITIAAVQSARSLCETVKRHKDRSKILRRLQEEVRDLTKLLGSLQKITYAEELVLEVLRGPIERCSQLCHDFRVSMEDFCRKSNTSLRDWAKMGFMNGGMDEFVDTIAGYKSTISIGLGIINMHTSKIYCGVILDFNEMIKDTAYDLELKLQRNDEKMTQLATASTDPPEDLRKETEVVKQCLRICEDARSYLESSSHRTSSLLLEMPEGVQENSGMAEVLTPQALDVNVSQTSGHFVVREASSTNGSTQIIGKMTDDGLKSMVERVYASRSGQSQRQGEKNYARTR